MLTARQVEVVRLMADGMEKKAIARRLGITTNTVKLHVAEIYRRLGVETATGAVGRCFREGWIE